MSTLGAEKAQQATALMPPGELWLFMTQEGTDPAVPLVFDTTSVGRAAFMIDQGGPKALVSKIDAGHFTEHSPFIQTRAYTRAFEDDLLAWLQELSPHTVLLNYSERDHLCDGLTHGQYLSTVKVLQRALGNVNIVSSEERLMRVRAIKTPEELRRLQRAIDLTIQFYDRLIPTLCAGMSEREIQARMNEVSAGLGVPYRPSEFGGPLVLINRVGMSHRAPTDQTVQPGDLLILDTALEYQGYFSDIARTTYFLRDGETSPPQKEQQVFQAIYGAIDAAFTALRPGVKGHEVDAAARHHLLKLGYPEIQHSTGHQIGRQVHDGGALLGPRWPGRWGSDLSVEEGMVFTLEPTVLMTPDPSMIVEENVVVTQDAARYLNPRQENLYTAR